MEFPKLSRKDKKLWTALMFLVRLLILSIPLYMVLWLNMSLLPLQNMVADHSVQILEAVGISTARDGLIISCGVSDPFIFYIGPDCTGWKSMLCFFALVFATMGVSMRKRILGVVVGIPLIYTGNIIRIVVVVLAEKSYGPEAAMLIHDWLWQAGLLGLVLVVWFAWLKWEKLKKHIIALRER